MAGLSYSGYLKAELCKLKPTGCCRIAECYGLLLLSRSFYRSEISIRTTSRETAEMYCSLIKLCFGAHTVLKANDKGTSFTASVAGEADREKIVNYYDSGEKDWILNPKFVRRTCCRRAFLRGAFLACGSVNDPSKGYHLEFAVKDPTLAFAFAAFLELCGHKCKHSARKSVTALYYNDSNVIEELLGEIGAGQKSLELMEVKVVRNMRNKLNRKNNFETANISKTVNAAVKQNEAIEFLIKENKLSLLPKELYDVAVLRRDNPEASLTEMCRLLGGGITRSGLNHRIKRIIAAAVDAGCEDLK